MRVIQAQQITDTVKELCIRANTQLPCMVRGLLQDARAKEPFAPAADTLDLILKNADIAADGCVPICQDTGMAVVYADVGQDVHIAGGLLEDAVNAGVALGYTEGYLRKSIVGDPIRRGNTGDNTPAVLHVRLMEGDRIRLTVAPKGFGSENMSRLCMLTPAQGLEGVKRFVVETAKLAGANPCPPMMLGVGVGGTFERVAQLAKEALIELREGPHPDPYYDALEKELLEEINALGIGPQGFGGRTTALSVRIKAFPTHIAGLPVAVNVGCHVTRHMSAEL
ncbi:MAG: fumarate hydratase [Clostridiales bacterium]|nr:fumarate hydratase [Clostridiales bacterium]